MAFEARRKRPSGLQLYLLDLKERKNWYRHDRNLLSETKLMDMYNKLFPLIKSAFTFDDDDKSENSQDELSNRSLNLSFLASWKLKFGLEVS